MLIYFNVNKLLGISFLPRHIDNFDLHYYNAAMTESLIFFIAEKAIHCWIEN